MTSWYVLVQAQQLDDDGLYESRLQLALRRMELRSQLYQQPERGEDLAAMIIEQVKPPHSFLLFIYQYLIGVDSFLG